MTEGMSIIGLLLAVCLALVHVFVSRSPWLARIPRRLWVSTAGGVSIAYIFLDIFPELSKAQADIEQELGIMTYLENHVYLLSLVGLVVFYGLETVAVRSRNYNQQQHGQDYTQAGVFWLHIGSFASYNAILGYLLHRSEEHGWVSGLLLFFALALHFVVNDVGLREHHKQAYDSAGRWILAGAIVTGWVLAQAVELSEATIAVIWALIAGGIIFNVLKEELPEEQDNHFGMFVMGIVVYAAVLLAV